MPSWVHALLKGLRGRSSPSAAEMANAFAYIQFKASRFLEVGADEYRLGDALGQPPAEWGPSTIEIVAHGCQQILEGRGRTPDRPLVGLGIPGFYKLLQLFHFKAGEQLLLGDGPSGMSSTAWRCVTSCTVGGSCSTTSWRARRPRLRKRHRKPPDVLRLGGSADRPDSPPDRLRQGFGVRRSSSEGGRRTLRRSTTPASVPCPRVRGSARNCSSRSAAPSSPAARAVD